MHLKKNHSFMKKVILSCLKMNLKISLKGILKNQKSIFDVKWHLNWYNHPFDICLNPLIMSKEGWFVRLGQEEVAWEWGKCLKYLKKGWNRKDRTKNKQFKKGRGKSWVKGSLKRGGYKFFMLHVSAAFKWRDTQNFWEEGEPYMGNLITP